MAHPMGESKQGGPSGRFRPPPEAGIPWIEGYYRRRIARLSGTRRFFFKALEQRGFEIKASQVDKRPKNETEYDY